MKYTDQEFIRLLEEVEAQGGQHSVEICPDRRYGFVGSKEPPLTIRGCGVESLLDIIYDPDEDVLVPTPVMIDNPDLEASEGDKRITKTVPRPVVIEEEWVTIDEPVTTLVEAKGSPESDGYPGVLTVCAFEDNVGAWPRFAKAVQGS